MGVLANLLGYGQNRKYSLQCNLLDGQLQETQKSNSQATDSSFTLSSAPLSAQARTVSVLYNSRQ